MFNGAMTQIQNSTHEELEPGRRNNADVAVCGSCVNKHHCAKNPGALEADDKPVCHVTPRPPLSGSAARREFGDSRF
jgi:hypothetical protein